MTTLAAALSVGCTRPAIPERAPDFDGVIVGRTPRLDAPPTAARLLLREPTLTPGPGLEAPVPARVTIEIGSATRSLEALPGGGGYRAAEPTDAWVGRRVRVWYAPGTPRGGGPGGADSALRSAAVIVAEAGS